MVIRKSDLEPEPLNGETYRQIGGAVHTRCGACGQWTPVWGAGSAVVGHMGFVPNKRAGLVNPRTGQEERPWKMVPFLRKVTACPACDHKYQLAIRQAENDGRPVFLDDGKGK